MMSCLIRDDEVYFAGGYMWNQIDAIDSISSRPFPILLSLLINFLPIIYSLLLYYSILLYSKWFFFYVLRIRFLCYYHMIRAFISLIGGLYSSRIVSILAFGSSRKIASSLIASWKKMSIIWCEVI